MEKLNRQWIGVVAGIILPAILYLIFFQAKMKHFSFIGDYYGSMLVKLLPVVLARCIFPNALLFFLLLWRNYVDLAKGVLWSSAVITALLLLISLIL